MAFDFMYLIPKEINSDSTNVQEDVKFLYTKAYKQISEGKDLKSALESLQAALDILWEDLNTGHWSEVPTSLKNLYALLSLLKVIGLSTKGKGEEGKEWYRDALRAADQGLMMGQGYHSQLSTAASHLNSLITQDLSSKTDGPLFSFQDKPDDWKISGVVGKILSTLDCPSLEQFSSQHFFPKLPVKLTGCMRQWEALERWQDVHYLLSQAGARTVPIELGSSYTESDWGMGLFTLADFVRDHILSPSSNRLGYLAQHPLFHQVPELLDDIKVPEYCCLTETEDEEPDQPRINSWFGPKGTVSPLHYDPDHNLLSQLIQARLEDHQNMESLVKLKNYHRLNDDCRAYLL